MAFGPMHCAHLGQVVEHIQRLTYTSAQAVMSNPCVLDAAGDCWLNDEVVEAYKVEQS